MQIDWLTVIAQIVNFLILVYLLKRFLYQPVIQAMDRREQRIAERLEQAEQREQTAAEEASRLKEQQDELSQRRDELITEAEEKAEERKRALLSEAREAVAQTRRQWEQQSEKEKEAFLRDLRTQVAELFPTLARQALSGLANAELEEQILHSFIARLASLDEESRAALAPVDGPVRIRTSFELGSTERSRLTRAVHEHVTPDAEIDYDVSSELLCGIDLAAGGRRLSWSLADYLDQLTGRIEAAITSPPQEG